MKQSLPGRRFTALPLFSFQIRDTLQQPGAGTLLALTLALPWVRAGWLFHPGGFRSVIATLAGLALLWTLFRSARFAQEIDSPALPKNEEKNSIAKRITNTVPLFLLFGYTLWTGLSLFWTNDLLASRLQFQTVLAFIVLTTAVSWVALQPRIRRACVTVLCVSSALCGIGAITLPQWIPNLLHGTGRYMFPYEHPAALAGSLAPVTVLLALWMLHSLLARNIRLALFASIGLLPCLIGLYTARTVTSLAGTGIAFFIGCMWLAPKKLRRILLAGSAFILIAGGWFVADLLRAPVSRERMLYAHSGGTRVLFGATALRMAAAHPLTGTGGGTFCRNTLAFEAKTDFLHGQRGDVVYSTHSEPLQILAELGLPGFLLWLGLHGWIFLRLWKRKTAGDVFLGLALLAMLIDSCGSMSMRYHELPWHYALVLGLALAASYHNNDMQHPSTTCLAWRRILCIPLLLAGLYASATAIGGLCAEIDLQQSHKQWYAKRPTRALTRVDRSLRFSGSLLTWYRAGQWNSYLLEKTGRFDKAVQMREIFLAHIPGDFVNRIRLSQLYYDRAAWDDAFRICVEGLQRNPYAPALDRQLTRLLHGASIADLNTWIAKCPTTLSEPDRAFLALRLSWDAGNTTPLSLPADRPFLESITISNAPYHAALHFLRARQPAQALALLEPHIQRVPADPRALALAANLLITHPQWNRIAEAYTLLERAILLGRTLPEVVEVAAPMLLAASEGARAESVVRAALKDNGTDPVLWITLIETLARRGKNAEANETLRQTKQRFPAESILQRFVLPNASSKHDTTQ